MTARTVPPLPGGISRLGLDDAFAAEEARKSNLIVQARLLTDEGRPEEAPPLYSEAAAVEFRLAAICRTNGLRTKARVHAYSAAGCSARAANFHDAISQAEALLAEPDLADVLRRSVEAFVRKLREGSRQAWTAITPDLPQSPSHSTPA